MSSCWISIYHAGSDICFHNFLQENGHPCIVFFPCIKTIKSRNSEQSNIFSLLCKTQWWTFENSITQILMSTPTPTPTPKHHTQSLSLGNTASFSTPSATSIAFYFSLCAASSIQDLSGFLLNSPIIFCLWSVTIFMQQYVLYSSVLLPRCFTVSRLTYHCWQKDPASYTHIMKALNVF